MRTRLRSATVLTLALALAATAHCGPDRNTGTDGRADASDATTDVARNDVVSDARDGGVLDARSDVVSDVRADVRTDAPNDVRPDVPADVRADVPRSEGGGGGTCSDSCMTNDECASRCGTMSGGVFCCSYSASDPSTPGTCYFNAATTCGGGMMMGGGDGGLGDDAGGDADLGDTGELDGAAGD